MTLLEVTGFVFGIAGIWLTIKEHWACFPVGLVNVIVSLFLFAEQRLYSDVIQQGVYIILLSYGWYQWKNRKVELRPIISFTNSSMKLVLVTAFIIVAAGMGYFFDQYTNADVPYLDSTATGLSFLAQYLIAKKKIENWMIWMVVNLMYTGIYIYKELYLYVILFVIYFVLAVIGFSKWKNEMMLQKTFIADEK